MIGVPWIWWVKIGITHVSIGAWERALSISDAFIGFAVPIMILPIPGAYQIEQRTHKILRCLSCRFYKGDGSSEWFWFPAALFIIPIMLTIIGIYIALIDTAFSTIFLPLYIDLIVSVLVWGWGYLSNIG